MPAAARITRTSNGVPTRATARDDSAGPHSGSRYGKGGASRPALSGTLLCPAVYELPSPMNPLMPACVTPVGVLHAVGSGGWKANVPSEDPPA